MLQNQFSETNCFLWTTSGRWIIFLVAHLHVHEKQESTCETWITSELNVAQLVQFLIVEPAQCSSLLWNLLTTIQVPNSAPMLDFFLDLFQDLTGTILPVVGDVPVDN